MESRSATPGQGLIGLLAQQQGAQLDSQAMQQTLGLLRDGDTGAVQRLLASSMSVQEKVSQVMPVRVEVLMSMFPAQGLDGAVRTAPRS